MTNEEIRQKVNDAFEEEFEIEKEKLVPEASIKDDLELDSLDIVDMVLVLEQTFSFKLPDRKALISIQTLGDIYTFIESLRDKQVITETSEPSSVERI